MQGSWDYQRLSEACTQEGCILCRLAQESTRRYLETWKDELFTDVDAREALRRSRGFCNAHTWQLVRMGASLPIAQAYRDVISDAIEHLENEDGKRRQRWFETKRNASDEAPCPACVHQDQVLARFIAVLRQALADTSFYTKFSASSGLCLDHFRLTCELKPSGADWLPLLRKAQLGCLQRLYEQLSEMIRKHDYRFKDEARGSEMLSWKRAAGIVASEDERV
jgi:hypothetical protein